MAQPPTVTPLRESPEQAARAEAELVRITRALVALGAERVVLFGSRARGDAVRGSDTDLIAVMPGVPGESFPARLARVWDAVRPRMAVDLLVYTPEELEALREDRAFVRQALAEGRVLHAG